MSVKELQAGLEILIRVKADVPKAGRWREALALVAAQVARAYEVTEREVAILLRTDDGMNLKFVYPLEMAEGPNNFPLASPSVAGKVVKSSRGVVDNAFPQTKHLGFYERLRLEGPKAGPIQKLVAAPIGGSGSTVGVIEVSRKGDDAAAAGADFTAQDLATLTEVGAVIAPYLQQLRPNLL